MPSTTPLRVAVRIRPPQPHDGKAAKLAPVIEAIDERRLGVSTEAGIKEFSFDRVFGPEATQHQVYMDCAQRLVDAVVDGTNACIFAFGATGAGKTHSMLGPEGGRNQEYHGGVLPRAASELFRRLARQEADSKAAIGVGGFSAYEVRASFTEVYRENTFDLLSGPVSSSREPSAACQLREDRDGRVYPEGAKVVRVSSASQLLAVVAAGAQARATAATGVHAHSSRSHAVLVLEVEHRWRDVHAPDPRSYKSQVSRFTLVDLAGAEDMERAHGGSYDAAGVGTNMGLLVLGRVLRSLAEGGGERVPYRDSTLTRLMQSCLGGTAVTQMLACVSPSSKEAGITLSTLGYATSAKSIRLRPEASKVVELQEDDPMAGDVEDQDQDLNRRSIWIETSYGDVFARCVGDPADPLILYVHGSGPDNSSMVWNDLAVELSQRAKASMPANAPSSFYHVAIDCPGYGRSPGDRQIIRSYPGGFIAECVVALGRSNAIALVGSSQGAASVFNAVLEMPDITQSVAVVHPVGHAPHRYTAIKQPVLLIFDREDDGHPVSVGRQMRRYLPDPRYFEFSRSVDGDWECQHTGEELWKVIRQVWPSLRKREKGTRDGRTECIRLAGGFRSWNERYKNEVLPWYGGQGPSQESIAEGDSGQTQDARAAGEDVAWRAVLEPATNTIVYENVRTGRRSKVRPPGARVIVQQADGGAAVASQAVPLFDRSDVEDSCDEDEIREKAAQQEAERLAREEQEVDCRLCGQPLVEPVRLAKCRCALCGCCAERTVRYTRQCPVCGMAVAVDTATKVPKSDAAEAWLHRLLALQPTPALEAQRELLSQVQAARSKTSRIVLEYGNISKSSGSKVAFTTFLKLIKVEGSAVGKNPVTKVDFNINPGYSKPTASVKQQEITDKKLGFAFEYAMARPYPCTMTVHFGKEVHLQLNIHYFVQATERCSRRIIIQLPSQALTSTKIEQANVLSEDYDDVPRNAWVRKVAGKRVQVEMLSI